MIFTFVLVERDSRGPARARTRWPRPTRRSRTTAG